jgi:uncharacterized surface protein with fasciclin (FAS1) repeats
MSSLWINAFRAAAVTATVVVAAGCGTSPGPTATPIGTHTSYPHAPASVPATAARVGPDCGMLPSSGAGSPKTMSTQEAIKAAASNPQLSVFIAAVRAAGLDATLDARHAFTLMIPENSSFAGLSKTDITHLRNSGDLKKIVSYHAVDGRIAPSRFAAGASVPTLEGGHVTVSKSGSTYEVNGAKVLCGNIRTSNATVYIISKVLLPPGT